MGSRFVFKDFSHLKKPENLLKQANIVKKLVRKGERKSNTNNVKLYEESFQPGNLNNISTKRMKVINSVYQTHVADIMSTGQSASLLKNFGIEVTKVRLNNDYKTINIYWIASCSPIKDLELAKILSNVAGEIQEEINGLNVIGESPKIKFVKDLFEVRRLEVTKILDDIKEELETETDETIKISEKSALPQMRHDTFGLTHSTIMESLLLSKAKARQPYRSSSRLIADKSEDKIFIPFDEKNFSKFVKKNFILTRHIQNYENSIADLQDFEEEDSYEPVDDLNDDCYD